MPGADGRERSRDGRRLWWAWLLLALVVVGAGGYAATRTDLLDVDSVEVVGAGGRLDRDHILAVAGVVPGEPMVGVDLGEVDRLVTAESWVEAVEVEREWPGTIRMSVLQRTAAVNAVDPAGRVALLDGDGTVLEHLEEADRALTSVRVDSFGDRARGLRGWDPS